LPKETTSKKGEEKESLSKHEKVLDTSKQKAYKGSNEKH
jgi:hypothetical protein